MKRTLVTPDIYEYPTLLWDYLVDCDVYDSSCSKEARVLFADKDEGFFVKSSPLGTLEKEALLTDHFNKKGMATEVLCYIQNEKDFLVTKAIKGEDCTFEPYLNDPKKLCRVLAECMRMLHAADKTDCPVKDRMKIYENTVFENYNKGVFDPLCFTENGSIMTRDEAFKYFWDNRYSLHSDHLIHGDFCLPNIMLDNWKFCAFIDLGNGGIGDKHIDIFWGIWTLWFNLKTKDYTDYFLDAYGKENVDMEKLFLIECAEAFG